MADEAVSEGLLGKQNLSVLGLRLRRMTVHIPEPELPDNQLGLEEAGPHHFKREPRHNNSCVGVGAFT